MLRNLRIAHPPADPYVRNARLLESIANPAKVRDVAKVSGTHIVKRNQKHLFPQGITHLPTVKMFLAVSASMS